MSFKTRADILCEVRDLLRSHAFSASETGLSEEMLSWCLDTTLDADLCKNLFRALREEQRALRLTSPPPRKSAAIVLSANVFTAAFRPLALHFFAGVPTRVKVSPRADAFANAFAEALLTIAPSEAARLQFATFSRHDIRATTWFEGAEVVRVYGSDETVSAVSKTLTSGQCLVAHGHGVGIAIVDESSIKNGIERDRTIERLSLDIAAYDQRGCMSPQTIWVLASEDAARAFAMDLAHAGLRNMDLVMPRAPLPIELAAAQSQWRGVARITGELFENATSAVSFEGPARFRASCGYRNVQVVTAYDIHEVVERSAALGAHLKRVGISGGLDVASIQADFSPTNPHARVTPIGTMQTPHVNEISDGRRPLEGLFLGRSG